MASNEIINRAFKILAKKYHPDLNSDNITYSNFKMSELNEAYEVLNDEHLREQYNLLYDLIILNKTNSKESDSTIKKDNENHYDESYYNNNNKTTKTKNNNTFTYIIITAVIFLIFQIVKSNIISINSQPTLDDDTLYSNSGYNDENADNFFLYLKSQNENINLEGYHNFTEDFSSTEVLVGFIIKDNTEIRNGPADDYDIIYSFNEDDLIIVVGKMNNWYDICIVNDQNSLYGWIPDDSIDTYWYNALNQQFVEHTINQTPNDDYRYYTADAENKSNSPSSNVNTVDDDKEVPIITTAGNFITLDSTKQDVINAMGTPDSVNDYSSFIVWGYGLSSIKFDNSGKVIGWNDLSNNLKDRVNRLIYLAMF